MRPIAFSIVLAILSCQTLAEAARVRQADLDRLLNSKVNHWRFHPGEVPGAEKPGFDDSAWQEVKTGFAWWPSDSTGWFRTVIVMPDHINGLPTAGTTVRLKLGVDNEAKAYVNGQFKQQFTWAGGDVVLTDHAVPGERITVALYGINRAGYGSLYEASLVSSRSEAMVKALRTLLQQCDYASGDLPWEPKEAAARWRFRIQDALDKLDLKAYRACQPDPFLASVQSAFAVLRGSPQEFEGTLQAVANRLSILTTQFQGADSADWRTPYIKTDLRVIESFIQYARDDMEDGDPMHAIRAVKTAQYLDRLSEEAGRRLEAMRGAPDDRPLPRYQTGRIEVHDGAFWQNGHPMYFTGVGHFGQVRKDTPILNDYGLNIIQIEMGPSNAMPDPGTIDEQAIRDNVVRALDVAAEHNVAVTLLVSPHYFPQWALEKNPELAQCGYGFIKYCIDAPESRAIIEKWLRTLMPLIKDHPALHSICLSNEPQYRGQCAWSKAKWAVWLQQKHGTIGAMNAIYGTHCADWTEVPMPKDRANYPLFFDWCRFNQDRFLEFHEFEKKIVHEYAPDLPVHAKVMSLAFRDPGAFENGINFEDFNQLGAIAGNDCPQMFNHEPSGEYAQEWQQMAMNYTLQHSTAPGSPIFNSEDHIIVDGDWHYVPGGDIRTDFWTQALHGQGAATTWVWERGQSGDLAENILTRANCVQALGSIALDLNRLGKEVYALQRVPAEASILYSYSSLLPSPDYVNEAQKAFEGSYFTGAPFDFITERQVLEGKLSRYKVVVVPMAGYAPDGVVEAFQQYINAGGAVLTVGPCFDRDEYARPRDKALRQSGTGRLDGYPVSLSSRAYREILNGLLEDRGVARPVRLQGRHGEPVWGVNLRAARDAGHTLVSLVNFTRKQQVVRLDSLIPTKNAINLFTGAKVRFPLALPSLDPVLIELPARHE